MRFGPDPYENDCLLKSQFHGKVNFLIVSADLGGCSTSHINYQVIHSPDKFYHNILLPYIEGDLNFQKVDKDTYQCELMGRYTNLAEIEYRNHL